MKDKSSSKQIARGSGSEKSSVLAEFVHIFFLWNIAFAQPLYDLLSRDAEFFVAHQTGPIQLVLFVVIVSFLMPTVLAGVLFCVSLSSFLGGRVMLLGLVGTLCAVMVAPLLEKPDVSGTTSLFLAFLFGIAGASLYHFVKRYSSTFYTLVVFFCALLFPIHFLFLTPVRELVFPQGILTDEVQEFRASEADVKPVPIVIVVFDEFNLVSLLDSSFQINKNRAPNFFRLARSSHWFRNATTVAQSTSYAIPAIFTGRFPDEVRLPTRQDYPDNLFGWLENTHNLHIFESVTELCPDHRRSAREPGEWKKTTVFARDVALVFLHIVLPEDLTGSLPAIDRNWANFGGFANPSSEGQEEGSGQATPQIMPEDANKVEQWRGFLDSMDPATESTMAANSADLHFIHLLLPHVPWSFLPSGKVYRTHTNPLTSVHGLTKGKWSENEMESLQAYQRYLLQLEYVDGLIGELLKRLHETGRYDETLLIVTADHGVSFQAGRSQRSISDESFYDIVGVPLFIKAPFQKEGVLVDSNAENIDVLPTIADVLGIDEVPWKVDGNSLFDGKQMARDTKTFYITGMGGKIFGSRTFAADLAPQREKNVERMIGVFGETTEDLFRFGPAGSILVGERLDDLEILDQGTHIKISLNRPAQYSRIDPAASYFPAMVTGWATSETLPNDQLELAIAVNGIIQAVTTTWAPEGKKQRFAALVPENAFQTSDNEIRVLEISDVRLGQLRNTR